MFICYIQDFLKEILLKQLVDARIYYSIVERKSILHPKNSLYCTRALLVKGWF